MKIYKIYSAAKCAVQDRRIITRGAKGKFKYGEIDKNYYEHLVQKSGPSTKNPIKLAKSFYNAYQHNMERIKYIERYMNMLENKEPSLPRKIYNRMFNK